MKKLMGIAMLASFLCVSCAHTKTDSEVQKKSYQKDADARLDTMEGRIQDLEKRSQQLIGEPKAELDHNLAALKSQTATARAELNELENRRDDTWLEKKTRVDEELYKMDQTYSTTLEIFQAH